VLLPLHCLVLGEALRLAEHGPERPHGSLGIGFCKSRPLCDSAQHLHHRVAVLLEEIAVDYNYRARRVSGEVSELEIERLDESVLSPEQRQGLDAIGAERRGGLGTVTDRNKADRRVRVQPGL